jgi:hypothetical protein
MAPETAGEVEISEVDLRYEACRVKNPRREGELLVDIQQRGIERPLAGAEDGGRWILIDGFKRLRCARRLAMTTVPHVSLAPGAAAGIASVLRGPGQKPLSFLEEARFVQELHCAHGMTLGEIAAAVGRSKSWASGRLAALADMSETTREAIFRGRFPAYAYLYFVRPFMRMNGVSGERIDAFVKAAGGRGLSTREIARLARAYFLGSDDLREQVEAGHIAAALAESAHAGAGAAACTGRERACLRDLVSTARAMETLPRRAADPRLASAAFRAQAELLLSRILGCAGEFATSMRRFHDRIRAP